MSSLAQLVIFSMKWREEPNLPDGVNNGENYVEQVAYIVAWDQLTNQQTDTMDHS